MLNGGYRIKGEKKTRAEPKPNAAFLGMGPNHHLWKFPSLELLRLSLLDEAPKFRRRLGTAPCVDGRSN